MSSKEKILLAALRHHEVCDGKLHQTVLRGTHFPAGGRYLWGPVLATPPHAFKPHFSFPPITLQSPFSTSPSRRVETHLDELKPILRRLYSLGTASRRGVFGVEVEASLGILFARPSAFARHISTS